jgi:adenosylcobinamide kinase / adenosylcobinamide-phosphate guanylyltransferase
MRELILGGQKSGKSRAAESRAAAWLATPGHEALLIATALAGDAEMAVRIDRHQQDRARRVPGLQTVEEPTSLASAVRAQGAAHRLLVIDCLTLWLTNLMQPLAGPPLNLDDVERATDDLTAAVHACKGPVVLVSNEIGWGVSPLCAQTRHFIDALGHLHQRLATVCEPVTLMVAGRALRLRPPEAM